MARVKLRSVFGKKKAVSTIINELSQVMDTTIAIKDADGLLLLGVDDENPPNQYPVELNGEVLGWVSGGEQVATVASLLSYLVGRETEKKSLANEVLDKYREVNLLYNISEKLMASLELQEVVKTALEEAGRLITGTTGAVLLADEATGMLETTSSFGQDDESPTSISVGQGIIGSVAQSGNAEIINDASSDSRFAEGGDLCNSLVCAPLKAKQKVIGVIFIGSEDSIAYTAADLKLLNTIASQAAPAIENALFYEKELKAAKEREERLQRQIEELRIELNEAKQELKVAEITETDHFQDLLSQADDLRAIMDDEE